MRVNRFSRSNWRYDRFVRVHAEALEQDRVITQTESFVRGRYQLSIQNRIGQDSFFALWIFNGFVEVERVQRHHDGRPIQLRLVETQVNI